jgi:hypothetical protein
MQEILHELMVALDEGQINAEVIEGAYKALSAVPENYHIKAVKALLRTPSAMEEQPEEQPEDYLQVKTYTSDKFSVGDEITDGCDKYVILKVETNGVWVTGTGTTMYVYTAASIAYRRTGRNFPAIAAIMEELKKA